MNARWWRDIGSTVDLSGRRRRRPSFFASFRLSEGFVRLHQTGDLTTREGRVVLCLRPSGDCPPCLFAVRRLGPPHCCLLSCVDVSLPPPQVWAIGTGLTATPADAQGIHKYVRSLLKEKYGDTVADGVRIQYGEQPLASLLRPVAGDARRD